MWKTFLWNYVFSKRAGSLIRVIALLSTIGIFVGVAALVIVMSVMNGFNDSIKRRYLAAEPHLLVSEKKEATAHLNEDLRTELLKDTNVLSVDWIETQDVILKTDYGLFGRAVAKGLDRDNLHSRLVEMKATYLRNHRTEEISDADIDRQSTTESDLLVNELEPNSILIGVDLGRGLGVLNGDRVLVVPPEILVLPPEMAPPTNETFVSNTIASEVADIDSNYLFYVRGETFKGLQKSLSRNEALEIRLKNPDFFWELREALRKRGYDVESWQDRNAALFFALKLEKLTMGTFLMISALITCCSILIVMVLLITQKQKEMGMMMAMGLSQRKATALFAKMGFALSCVGSLGGLLFGISIALALQGNRWGILPDIYYDNTIPSRVEPISILWMALSVFLFSALMSYLPAMYLARQVPSESLRK